MKKSILKIFFKPLTIINKVLKKDKNLIFFYSNLGFRDNVKAFYDYLIANGYNKRFRIVVSINDYEDYVGTAPENVSFISNNKGIKVFMKAKYAFYCFGKYPIKPAKSQVVVNLWHGTPLKKIGNLEKGLENVDYNFFSKVLTTSPMYVPIMMQIFGCSEEQVDVIGNARNDEMFVEDKVKDALIKTTAKMILWLPTYREYDDSFLISVLGEGDLSDLDEFLSIKNCQLIIKLHPLQKLQDKFSRFKNIRFLTQEDLKKLDVSVYGLLRNADGLITDYSSVYFDYMLMDRPIAFAVDDMEKYNKERGFIFDNPWDFMPGSNVNKLEDLEMFINDVINGVDSYKEKRHKINDKINYYKDGECCRRIAEKYIV